MQKETVEMLIKHPVLTAKAKYKNYRQDKFYKSFKPQIFEKLSDKKAIKLRYKLNFGKYPDLKNPKTFNEKLQWLKLYNRRPEYTMMVDKYEVKDYVAKIIGEEYIIPTYGVWERAEDINFDALPNQFVLKCTHDSASVIICKDKEKFDIASACEKLNNCLKRSLFLYGREWPYKNVKPRIIAEKYLEDADVGELRDYKFFCFDGECKAMYVGSNRQNADVETCTDYFDSDFNRLNLRNAAHINSKTPPEKPKNFEQMKKFAGILSKGIPHARIDFYDCNDHVYFGEITFFQGSGFSWFNPPEWDYTFGSWIELPKKKIK